MTDKISNAATDKHTTPLINTNLSELLIIYISLIIKVYVYYTKKDHISMWSLCNGFDLFYNRNFDFNGSSINVCNFTECSARQVKKTAIFFKASGVVHLNHDTFSIVYVGDA